MPLAGDAESHAASSVVVNESVPPPVLAIASDLAAGAAPPSTTAKARFAGVTDSAGGCGGSTVSVTGISFGEPATPADSTRTVAVCVPAARPAVLTATLRSRGAVPRARRDGEPRSVVGRREDQRAPAGVGDGKRLRGRVRAAGDAAVGERRGRDGERGRRRRARRHAEHVRRQRAVAPDRAGLPRRRQRGQRAAGAPLLGAAGAAGAVVPAQHAGRSGRVEQADPVRRARGDRRPVVDRHLVPGAGLRSC